MSNRKKSEKEDKKDPFVKRMDALLRLFLENYKMVNKDFTEKDAAILLNSVGLTPTEIAIIMGKKDRKSVSPYLYSKEKRKSKR